MPTAYSKDSLPSALRDAKEEGVARFLKTRVSPYKLVAYAANTGTDQNVVGVGIGRKVVKGKEIARPCVRFYVVHKLAKASISKGNLLPAKIGAVETDVVETGVFHAFALSAGIAKARSRLRPAKPGCSIGFEFTGDQANMVMAGTFGAVVTKDGKRFILSNNHVLADENRLPLGSAIFQPGLLDGGDATKDDIAELTQFVRLQADMPNTVDCAIAQVGNAKDVSGTCLPSVGKLKSVAPLAANEGLAVMKVGRTTGYTQGRITDVSATVRVGYDIGDLTFNNQMMIVGSPGQFSAAGDSGSLIVSRTSKRPVGLLFAGSSTHTMANHIDEVLAALGVAILI